MNTTIIFILSICGSAFIIVLGLALMKAAAPKNTRERFIDDYQKMKALGYFEEDTFTSGSPIDRE